MLHGGQSNVAFVPLQKTRPSSSSVSVGSSPSPSFSWLSTTLVTRTSRREWFEAVALSEPTAVSELFFFIHSGHGPLEHGRGHP